MTGNVGGLAIFQNSGECIQKRNYNRNSTNLNEGSHSVQYLPKTDNTSKNYLFLTSIVECQSKRWAFRQNCGSNLMKDNNISKNTVDRDAISIASFNDFSFSIIKNNTAKTGTICYLYSGNSTMKCCSFISNIDKHVDMYNGLFYFEKGNFIFMKLILENNNLGNIIMNYNASSVEFVDCYLSENVYQRTSYGAKISLNQTDTKFISFNCRTKIESTENYEEGFMSNYHVFDTVFAVFISTHIDFE